MIGKISWNRLLKGLSEPAAHWIGRPRQAGTAYSPSLILKLCHSLLSSHGEATGMALAEEILAGWVSLDEAGRRVVMQGLLIQFGPDLTKLEAAIAAHRVEPTAENVQRLHEASEPRRQKLIRRLNLARHGTVTLVDMRSQLQEFKKDDVTLEVVDADFLHLFSSWFNRGFLVLRSIEWTTPANVLEKIIRYEAVHEIKGWRDLRQRLEPEDRRCFAFFHPQLPDEPLIFVEVALTKEIPASVNALLLDQRETVPADEASTAVFYSISNCQTGLKGVSFGSFLIKQVVEELRRELPNLKVFATLSPVVGLAGWLRKKGQTFYNDTAFGGDKDALMAAVLDYFFSARARDGRHVDPVARFHLGNGARLERILLGADNSENGLRQSFGVMVNYLYKLDEIVANHEAYVQRGEVVASPQLVRSWHAHRPLDAAKRLKSRQA